MNFIDDKKCFLCFKEGKMITCCGCMFNLYCSKKCQENHWKVHKNECCEEYGKACLVIVKRSRGVIWKLKELWNQMEKIGIDKIKLISYQIDDYLLPFKLKVYTKKGVKMETKYEKSLIIWKSYRDKRGIQSALLEFDLMKLFLNMIK